MNERSADFLLDNTFMWLALLMGSGCVAGSAYGLWRGRNVRQRTRRLLGGAGGGTSGRRRSGRPESSLLAGGGTVGQGRDRNALAQWLMHRPLREGAAALGAGAFAVTLIGGAAGWLAAAAGAYGVWRWMRERQARAHGSGDETEEGAAAEQLPLAAELMAACLAAGSSPAQAADAVGQSLGGPLGARLMGAATELRLGAEPASVWGRLRSLPGGESFARCMERAGTAGVPAVEPVTRLAAELRARRARAASARARRAAVLVTGPLGLCFLPAFLAVGVAPVVMGLARSLM